MQFSNSLPWAQPNVQRELVHRGHPISLRGLETLHDVRTFTQLTLLAYLYAEKKVKKHQLRIPLMMISSSSGLPAKDIDLLFECQLATVRSTLTNSPHIFDRFRGSP
jgi:hypothetical protein